MSDSEKSKWMLVFVVVLLLIAVTPATAQEPVRKNAKPALGPIDAETAAMIRKIVQADGWRRPADVDEANLSNFHNMEWPTEIPGDGWGLREINFDFTTGFSWIDQPRKCHFVIWAYGPQAAKEVFPIHAAEYYTPVFTSGGPYWTYRYEGYWEGNYFFIILEGPPIEGAAGNEGFIQWWLDISHNWLHGPYIKSHWTSWRNTAYCEDEVVGDPYYTWGTYVLKIGPDGVPHRHYLHMPYVK